MPGAANNAPRPELCGIARPILHWICPTCGAPACDHAGYVTSRRDAHYGHAMVRLACGHLAEADRRAVERRGMDVLRCVSCIPGEWVIHQRELERMKTRATRERRRATAARVVRERVTA